MPYAIPDAHDGHESQHANAPYPSNTSHTLRTIPRCCAARAHANGTSHEQSPVASLFASDLMFDPVAACPHEATASLPE